MASFTSGRWHILYAGQDDMTEQECIEEEMPVVAIPPVINYAEFAKEGTAEERANALLISLAPEMLSSLKNYCDYEDSWGVHIASEAYMRAKDAIARAEGREDV